MIAIAPDTDLEPLAEPREAPLLSLRGVAKGYRQEGGFRPVLDGVNLDVAQGEFLAIVGFSGSGKSTLMSLIAGLTTPDRGEIRLKGERITGPSPDRAIVFQNYSLLPWLTVTENVLLAVDERFPHWTGAQRREHVQKYLQLVNLATAADKRPAQLSGGMRQRVSVVRALAMNPDILLLDEPLSALDALTRATLQDELERIWRLERKTIVLITNHVDEAILLADRIVPITPGPRAKLGPSFPVEIARPRDRQRMNHDPQFQQLRRDVTHYLLETRRQLAEASDRESSPVAASH